MGLLDQLKKEIEYHSDTGEFWWIIHGHARPKHKPAGYVSLAGYRKILFKKTLYSAHRLAWFFVHGEWPKKQIDHINHNRDDNRIANLRDVSPAVNSRHRVRQRNLPVGIQRTSSGKYIARVQKHWSRSMPNVTMALLWLAALRARYDDL